MKQLPLYLVAVLFFGAGMLCVAELITLAFEVSGVGFQAATRATAMRPDMIQWRLAAYVLGLGLVLFGVYHLVRRHRATPWVMLAMTVFLALQLLIQRPIASGTQSVPDLYANRIMLLMPLVAGSAYLFTRRFRVSEIS